VKQHHAAVVALVVLIRIAVDMEFAATDVIEDKEPVLFDAIQVEPPQILKIG
jgi:hypothetical protein